MPETPIPQALWPIRDRVEEMRGRARNARRESEDARLKAELYDQEAIMLGLALDKTVKALTTEDSDGR
jgi:hypothetical protein